MDGTAPFFVVGSARSGTTLLRLMLNSHPEVAVPPESRLITALWTGAEEVGVDDFLAGLDELRKRSDSTRRWELSNEAVRRELNYRARARYRDVASACYAAYARAHGKKRWAVKTPGYVEKIDFLADLFPESRFVHLIRDGRNVALSYADVPFGPKTLGKAAVLWARRVSAGIEAGRALPRGRYLEMLYEDLVEDPEGEMRSLSDFLDLPFDPAVLRYEGSDALPKSASQNPHVGKGPRAGVRVWQEQMPARLVEIFEAIAGDVLSLVGYERRYPRPSLSATALGRLAGWGLPVGRLTGNHSATARVE